jgi:hypothetical protein
MMNNDSSRVRLSELVLQSFASSLQTAKANSPFGEPVPGRILQGPDEISAANPVEISSANSQSQLPIPCLAQTKRCIKRPTRIANVISVVRREVLAETQNIRLRVDLRLVSKEMLIGIGPWEIPYDDVRLVDTSGFSASEGKAQRLQ